MNILGDMGGDITIHVAALTSPDSDDVVPVRYTSATKFLVQVGRHKSGSYRTRWEFTGNLAQAISYYNGINIGRGYKKRLIAPSFNKPVLARATS